MVYSVEQRECAKFQTEHGGTIGQWPAGFPPRPNSKQDLFLVKVFDILLSKTDFFLLFYFQRDSDCKLTFPNFSFRRFSISKGIKVMNI